MARRRGPIPDEPARHPIVFLTADEERALAARVAAGGPDGLAARNELVERNLPYARHLARRWAGPGRDFEDLLSLAHLGLIRAAETFDPDRGRFTTHADRRIRHRLRRGLDNEGSLIRVPVNLHELRRAVAHGVVDPADLPPEHLGYLAAADRVLRVRPGRRADDGHDRDDPVAMLPSPPAEDRPFGPDELARLGPLLGTLSPRSRAILAARFGLDGRGGLEFGAIAAEHGLSDSRIQQLVIQALARLRRAARLGLPRDGLPSTAPRPEETPAMAGAAPGGGVRSGAEVLTEVPAMDGDANGVVAEAKPSARTADLDPEDCAAIRRLHAEEPGLTAAQIAARLVETTGRKLDGRAVRGVLWSSDPGPSVRPRIQQTPPVAVIPPAPAPVPRPDPPAPAPTPSPPAGPDDDDPELAALVVICRALRGLEPDQVDRVLRYAGERAKGST